MRYTKRACMTPRFMVRVYNGTTVVHTPGTGDRVRISNSAAGVCAVVMSVSLQLFLECVCAHITNWSYLLHTAIKSAAFQYLLHSDSPVVISKSTGWPPHADFRQPLR